MEQGLEMHIALGSGQKLPVHRVCLEISFSLPNKAVCELVLVVLPCYNIVKGSNYKFSCYIL